MNKAPFEALLLPIDKSLIDLEKVMKPFGEAQKRLGELNERISEDNAYRTHAFHHLVKAESFYSTRIEGTQTTIDAVYEAEADTKDIKVDTDVGEVLKYRDAIYQGSKYVKDDPITCKLIKQIHEILLSGDKVRKNTNFQPGEFRSQQNKVGSHIPPTAIMVDKLMGNLEKYINLDYGYADDLPHLIRIALIHAQFETIHPFPDGNGRVGRVLIPLYLFKEKEIKTPYFFISQELEKNKIKYYSYLQETRNKNKEGFTNWICFFLQSAKNQCEHDLKYLRSLQLLFNETIQKISELKNSIKKDAIVNFIFKNPVFTTSKISEETGIPKTTLYPYLTLMVNEKILYSDQRPRNRMFYFMELIELLRR